ncbi:cyclic lactone autoinducer peptide [Anaerobacterium chartisolvens]|uniref:cyclic lactone autoinducer peptide n=1 Tax=Anaerobacterium chartisolvens TaxID=1297424 RepID=UPI001FA935C1|nr:cyclic lactone autoinducer peptide [Anaerobacterium chartisolvens]
MKLKKELGFKVKGKMAYRLNALIICSSFLILIATVVASSASWWAFYQPKLPKSISGKGRN